MSNLSEKIKEREKKSQQNKLMMNVLGVVVIIFMISSIMLYTQLKKEKKALTESEANLLKSEKSLIDSNRDLEIKDSILSLKNEKLLQLRGSIDNYWQEADNSGNIKDYANYLKRAIEGDKHYQEALEKMNTLARKRGYVQITNRNGTKNLKKIENLNTDDIYYEVTQSMNVNYGAKGHPDFNNRNTSRKIGEVVQKYDVVKIIKVYTYTSSKAEWAEIGYQ